uniref:Calmodulin-binding protein-like n=1 Tax=Oryza nivara TaxID=4536 RepID=A0A0E0I3X1_ORYNI
MSAAAADTVSGDDHHLATGGDSACSTPFVSAPSSPAARDAPFPGGFFSAPASPAHHHHHHGGEGGGDGEEYEFEFDFSSRFPSPAPAAMSSADELFHNGQIRPMRLPPLVGGGETPREELEVGAGDERGGRLRCRSVRRRSRSHSPFRTWLSPPPPPPPPSAAPVANAAAPSVSRSSSSSSTASSASASSSSSSSSRSSRRWRFLKDLLHRSGSDGGKDQRPPPPIAPPRSPAPAAARGGRRRSAHERMYAARRAEVEEMRRRTFLPYQQGLLFGCLGLTSRLSGAAAGKSRVFTPSTPRALSECQEHFLSASPECQAVISMPNGQPNDDRCRLLTGQRGMLGIMTASSFSGSNLKMPKLLIRKSLLFSLGHYPFRCHD